MKDNQLRILNKNNEIARQFNRELIKGSLKGLGIGLNICFVAASLLRANLKFNHNPEGGTCVEVKFKADKVDSKNSFNLLEDKSILIVDDIRINRDVLGLMFKGQNVKLGFAKNGQEAIDKFIKERYDIILMDTQMPVKTGDQALKEIRLVDPEQMIIAITANGTQLDRKKYLDFGFDDFLAKPFNKNDLLTSINHVMMIKNTI